MFQTAGEDARQAEADAAPQSRSAAYRLAFADTDFLLRDELRPVRLQLELLKPELALAEHGINSTVVIFGSARTSGGIRGGIDLDQALAEARRLARLVSRYGQGRDGPAEFVVVTGGGGGVMAAANQGAADVGAKSIGFNVVLPHEQHPNPYVTPELCFRFHYFAIRKMHLLLRARAVICFPGGFGTLDELFETLTLIQTGKMTAVPVVLFDRTFWSRVLNVEALVDAGLIAPKDARSFTMVDSADAAWEVIRAHYGLDVEPD
ncbi:MAG: LOG family protein [Pseudomonadota bacterium]